MHPKFFKTLTIIVNLLAIIVGLWICLYAFGNQFSRVFGEYYFQYAYYFLTQSISYLTILLVVLVIIYMFLVKKSRK